MIVLLELMDRWTHGITAEIAVKRDTVEMRVRDHLVGIADRDYLRGWLRAPEGCYAYDDVLWGVAGNGVMLAVDERVPMWPLSDHQLSQLREAV